MVPTLQERAGHALAVLHRARAGGERFVGGVPARRVGAADAGRGFADEWAAANLEARHDSGRLWVVLGDGASLGLGASTREMSFVPLVAEALAADGAAWRVMNLAAAGAGIDDVLARQLPELAELTADDPADLVTCIVGAADVREQAARQRGPAACAARRPAGGRGRRDPPAGREHPQLGGVERVGPQGGQPARPARRGRLGRQPAARTLVRRRLPAQRRRPRPVGGGGPRGRPG